MNGFESNGPGLQYKVSWRQKDGDDEWTSVVVANVSKYIVSGTPTFVPYLIKVQALNDAGFAPEPAVVTGHSGEDRKYPMLFCVYFSPSKTDYQGASPGHVQRNLDWEGGRQQRFCSTLLHLNSLLI